MTSSTTRLERITSAYWEASHACRSPEESDMTTSDAFKLIREGDSLPLERWKLRDLLHVLRYDLVEGNTQWRENKKRNANILPLIRCTKS